MARPSQVQDSDLRRLIEEARAAYLADDNRGSIEKSTAAFLELLRRQPDFLSAGPFARNNRRVWPQLGVTLKTGDDAPPEVTFERERFTNPEAITYYEYVSDCLVAARL